MITIIISPKAADTAKSKLGIIPDKAAGRTTYFKLVEASDNEASRKDCIPVFITSHDSEGIKGIIIIRTNRPAPSAEPWATSRPKSIPRSCINGATVGAAKKP